MQFAISDIIELFDGIFAESYRTRLVSGRDEPLYLPARSNTDYHQVIFAHGFFASALHELSHWCIAGEARRQLEDYGYWYEPDGRSESQQIEFEKVEIAPQAIELLLSQSCGKSFQVSVDNLGGVEVDRHAFQNRVEARAERYQLEGVPLRAHALMDALSAFYLEQVTLPEAITKGLQRLTAAG